MRELWSYRLKEHAQSRVVVWTKRDVKQRLKDVVEKLLKAVHQSSDEVLVTANDTGANCLCTNQWRINHEAMEARASGPQFLGKKIGPAFPDWS